MSAASAAFAGLVTCKHPMHPFSIFVINLKTQRWWFVIHKSNKGRNKL